MRKALQNGFHFYRHYRHRRPLQKQGTAHHLYFHLTKTLALPGPAVPRLLGGTLLGCRGQWLSSAAALCCYPDQQSCEQPPHWSYPPPGPRFADSLWPRGAQIPAPPHTPALAATERSRQHGRSKALSQHAGLSCRGSVHKPFDQQFGSPCRRFPGAWRFRLCPAWVPGAGEGGDELATGTNALTGTSTKSRRQSVMFIIFEAKQTCGLLMYLERINWEAPQSSRV